MTTAPRTKPHREFFRVALDLPADGTPWTPVAGWEGRVEELLLADNLDPVARTGSRTRLVRWHAGTLMPDPAIHDFHEEVFIVSGDLVVGCDAQGAGGESFGAWTFACRPPNVAHGPFVTRTGCVMLEFDYYA